jgi:16S rRNA processing protein RimM
LKVINQDGILLGEVSEIIETGANDVFVIIDNDNNEQKILIPSVMGIYINKIDLIEQAIYVNWAIGD